MSKRTFTRRELGRQALAGAAGALLLPALATGARAQVVDPAPAVPPPLPLAPAPPTPPAPSSEGDLLIALVPLLAGYALSEGQAREVARRLRDYPGSFAQARAFAIPDDVGPAFAADAPPRKGRSQ